MRVLLFANVSTKRGWPLFEVQCCFGNEFGITFPLKDEKKYKYLQIVPLPLKFHVCAHFTIILVSEYWNWKADKAWFQVLVRKKSFECCYLSFSWRTGDHNFHELTLGGNPAVFHPIMVGELTFCVFSEKLEISNQNYFHL